MSDVRNHVVERILSRVATGDTARDVHSHTTERQPSAQALHLHIESCDGKEAEGGPWLTQTRYKWRDLGNRERLRLLFGDWGVEIEGHNLMVLVDEFREGQLNGVRELTSPEETLLENENPQDEPIITSAKCYPDFDQTFEEIKGESDEQPTRQLKRAK